MGPPQKSHRNTPDEDLHPGRPAHHFLCCAHERTPRQTPPTPARNSGGAVAGLAGAYLKSAAEPPLQTLTEHYFPPTNAQKQMIGADPTGRIDHMPPPR
ncbi:hypothetical protein [Deinococcus saxicola]|uniref:hypothetical protein n=1 Tax=Deinococcus saxicola TaxID=249406 RepID=UPI0039EE2988